MAMAAREAVATLETAALVVTAAVVESVAARAVEVRVKVDTEMVWRLAVHP